ncbi:AAA family ATPase [Candidatus Woesearchaeota archaeon]|nr:AAA family ATPase [Candidatus Woesearchaeota archaeon]
MIEIEKLKRTFDAVFTETDKVIVGQRDIIEQVLVAMLADSNALLESYPGLGKTLTIKTLSQVMDMKFSRIQCTPDLMPSDITGTEIIEESGGKRFFKFQEGPVFSNILLADEINRATPKTQSALLEAMQEKQVTVGNKTYQLDRPFFVLATQNPIEQEGSLALDQYVFVNGQLKTGHQLLALVGDNCIAEDEKGIKLYNLDGYTLSLNTAAVLEKQHCYLYTLPYTDEMIAITTKTGKEIKVTKNHPFLVNDNGTICWKKAEELTKYDHLVNPARIKVDSKQIKIPTHEETLAQMDQKAIVQEITFDEDFAFWIAFLLSDGYIGEKTVQAVQKNYPEALDRFVAISQKYGFNPNVSLNRGCRYATIYSKPLVEYLNIRFGVTGGKDKEIPSWFLSWSEAMNREFVKTFICLESSLRDNRIVFTQKSKNNMNIISYMLLREGIISFPRFDGKIYRLKIQGEDCVKFLNRIGWINEEKAAIVDCMRKIKSSFRVVPVQRNAILKLVNLLGINSFHTLKERTNITERSWYGSYQGIKQGETLMAVDSLREFVQDIENELFLRKQQSHDDILETDPRQFAATIGTSMTEVAELLQISHNQVWGYYTGKNSQSIVQIKTVLQEKKVLCLEEAQKLLNYCKALLSEDVYYDAIKTIEYSPSQGMAFGLTVPETQNYIAGFGGCGINHNTYPLPEAQTDRFLLKIKVDYPTFDEEVEIVKRYTKILKEEPIKKILGKNSFLALQKFTREVPIADDLAKDVVKIIGLTRSEKEFIEYGSSPRASIGLILAAKATALMNGRSHVSAKDIEKMAYPILRHRIILNFEAERKGLTNDDVIRKILEKTIGTTDKEKTKKDK